MRCRLAFILVLFYVLWVDARQNKKQLEKTQRQLENYQKDERKLENYQKGQNMNMGRFNYIKRSVRQNDHATETPPYIYSARPPWNPPSAPALLKAALVYPFWLLNYFLG